jgi:hypothetical protein
MILNGYFERGSNFIQDSLAFKIRFLLEASAVSLNNTPSERPVNPNKLRSSC